MKKCILSLFTFFLFVADLQTASIHAVNHYQLIVPHHLASCPEPLIVKKSDTPEAPKSKTLFEHMFHMSPPSFNHAPLSNYKQLVLCYELFGKSAYPTTTCITHNVIKELELLSGMATPEKSILKELGSTIITEGSVYLAGLLTHPITDQETLKKRQAIIAELAENEAITKSLTKLLTEVAATEHILFSLWNEEQKGEQFMIDGGYWQTNVLRGLNSNLPYQHTVSTLQLAIQPALIVVPEVVAGVQIYKNFDPIKFAYNHYSTTSPALTYAYLGVLGCYVGFMNYMLFDFVKKYFQTLNYLHEKTNSAAAVIRALDRCARIIKQTPALQHLENKKAFTNFARLTPTLSSKMKKLVTLLRTNTFKGRVSHFSLKGRVKAAYALLKDVKEELVPALIALGEIDAYLSCAKLYKKYQGKPNAFVFATYLSQETPCIRMDGMWNLFVGSEQSIANSIELGTENLPHNIILTGPNAGGKSTFIKGLTINVLFAQTIGIVPARSFSLTPFSAINTYMNIADDTADGKSLFKAEVIRAQELITSIDTLPKNQFAFSAMDEVFSGTSPKEGEAASYAVAHELGSRKNSILILATHFPKLKELEKATSYFKNYQVRVVRHTNGSFSYPFKLEEGAADQNVAIDILKEQGFSSSILDKANQLLA